MAFHDPLDATAWCAATQQVGRPAALASSGTPCPSAVRFCKKCKILCKIVCEIFLCCKISVASCALATKCRDPLLPCLRGMSRQCSHLCDGAAYDARCPPATPLCWLGQERCDMHPVQHVYLRTLSWAAMFLSGGLRVVPHYMQAWFCGGHVWDCQLQACRWGFHHQPGGLGRGLPGCGRCRPCLAGMAAWCTQHRLCLFRPFWLPNGLVVWKSMRAPGYACTLPGPQPTRARPFWPDMILSRLHAAHRALQQLTTLHQRSWLPMHTISMPGRWEPSVMTLTRPALLQCLHIAKG